MIYPPPIDMFSASYQSTPMAITKPQKTITLLEQYPIPQNNRQQTNNL